MGQHSMHQSCIRYISADRISSLRQVKIGVVEMYLSISIHKYCLYIVGYVLLHGLVQMRAEGLISDALLNASTLGHGRCSK